MAARFEKQLLRTLLASAWAAGLALPTHAQQGVIEPTTIGAAPSARHIAEAALYERALERGDKEAAETHAYAAWRAAETELGDHRRTAVLAFNYGREIAMSDATLARGVLARSRDLVEAGYDGPAMAMLDLYTAYADFAAVAPKNRNGKELREALIATEGATDRRPAHDVVMWLDIAKNDLDKDRFEQAVEAAGKAETAIIIFEPENERGLADVFLVRGVASLAPRKRTVDEALTAIEYLENGRRLIPAQKNYETFDPTLASLVGWSTAAAALVRTMTDDPDVLALLDKETNNALFEKTADAPLDCLISWEERTPPEFPQTALAKHNFGAAVAVFDIGDDLSIQNVRILAHAPSDDFDDAVINAVSDWRLKFPPLDHPACRRNITTQFSFVVE